MPRPVKPRWIEFSPGITYFKPAGVPMRELEEILLGLDEVESLRLKDLVGLEQEQCAERMGVAQSTFQRILTSARNKVASALIEGKALRVEGGNCLISPLVFTCSACGSTWENEDRSLGVPSCPRCGGKDVTLSRPNPYLGDKEAPGQGCGHRRRGGQHTRRGHGQGPGPAPDQEGGFGRDFGRGGPR